MNSGQPSTGEQQMDQMREVFIWSPYKSIWRASTQLAIPATTAWTVLHKRLKFKPYKLQLSQALSEEDNVRRAAFCENLH
jgi:hypothetical protein